MALWTRDAVLQHFCTVLNATHKTLLRKSWNYYSLMKIIILLSLNIDGMLSCVVTQTAKIKRLQNFVFIIDAACIQPLHRPCSTYLWTKVYVTVGCPSVRPSVCPSIDSSIDIRMFAAELRRGQQMSISSCWRRVPPIDRYLLPAPELRLRVAACWEPRWQAQCRLI